MAVLAECPFCHRRQSVRAKRCKSLKGKGCGADMEAARKARKIKYWIAFRLPGGKQKFQKLTGEKANSIEYARDADSKRKVQKRENRIFEILPEAKMTFQELTDWYLGLEKIKALAYFPTLKIYLKKFNSEFGNVMVNQIKAADLENLQAKRKGEGMADATVDQEIGAARGVIHKAFDNDMVSGDTLKVFKKVNKLLRRNSNARNKILTPAEFKALLDSESLPMHTRGIIATGFYTGMRRREILSLTWQKVDMKNRVIHLEAADTKDREARAIPICNELYDILRMIPPAIHDDHVFLFRGNPVRDIREGLRGACEDAGIEYGRRSKDGFVFHDLRHCFNTYMRKAGVAESVIMHLTGHSSREMFDRYNRVDEEDTRKALVQMSSFLETVDQSVDQKEKSGS
jgi:integrase